MRRRLIVSAAVAVCTLVLVSAPTAWSEDTEYAIRLDAPTSLSPGADGIIALTLTPSAGQRISSEGPVRIAVSVTPSSGLRLARRRLRRKHAEDPKASALRFSIGVGAEEPGSYQLALDIRFWICGAKTCRPIRERRQIALEVETAQAPDAGPDGSGNAAGGR